MTEQSKETKQLAQQRNDIKSQINELNIRLSTNKENLENSMLSDSGLSVGDIVEAIEGTYSCAIGTRFKLASFKLGWADTLEYKGFKKLKSGKFSTKMANKIYADIRKVEND